MRTLVKFAAFLCLAVAPTSAQTTIPYGTTDLRIALDRLSVLGSALYVAAHPDDENTSVISSLSKGRLVRTAYLSMTRGEGGQNLIGSEQGELLGILRTQELLEARAIDGGAQFFTRAIDFGYSKTSEETIRIWGRERIVGDIVWVIRSFRPDVIMTRFSDTLGTHGNHTGSAILAREAFEAAGDPAKFPEQLKYVRPFRPKRIVFNVFRFGSSGMDPGPNAVGLDVGMYNVILGRSYTEIAGRSRSMHKSQGFGAAENRGTNLQYFEPTLGEPAVRDLFDGVDLGWSRIPGGVPVGRIIRQARDAFDMDNPAKIIPILLKAVEELKKLSGDPWIEIKRREIAEVILGCAGVWIEANASDYSASPGQRVPITTTVITRSNERIAFLSVRSPLSMQDSSVGISLTNNRPERVNSSIVLPPDLKYSQPYWLVNKTTNGSYDVEDKGLVSQPENKPFMVSVELEIGGERLRVDVPLRYKWVDPVQGELTRAFVVVPPVSVRLTEPVYVAAGNDEKRVRVLLAAVGTASQGTVRLEVPAGWSVVPDRRSFNLKAKHEELSLDFQIGPKGSNAVDGVVRAIVETDGESDSRGMVTIQYPHISPQVMFPEASAKIIRLQMVKPGGTIGYIEGSGDGIPAALMQLGYTVRLLTDDDLESADLNSLDAIVAGVRAYNTRPRLKAQQQRLMEYVRGGGRYVVQYVTRQRSEAENLGPYPFTISRDRVTEEGAPVDFLNVTHPVLNTPNRITKEDFQGWVQERGLYFANEWDARYEAILTSYDPGESPKRGGLLFARYGKGAFVYNGYSLFRQLPAGVPGAYRLLVNLISAK
ncbi:MAG: PIG-L family deacetylase [Bacteroidota bacterium]